MRAGWRSDIPATRNGKHRPLGHADTMPVRCLIVDDNPDFLHVARELLERDGLSVVGLVSTEAQACRLCREQRPDVALIDIDLGEESGFEVARQLAGQARPPQPCMILTSAYPEDEFADMIAESPAVSFLPKAELSGPAIRGILARAGRQPRRGLSAIRDRRAPRERADGRSRPPAAASGRGCRARASRPFPR